MVTHINVAVDDETGDRARELKEQRGWSWEEFIEHALDEFEDEH